MDTLGQVVAQVPGIVEAYVPQLLIEGDPEPRQVLIVGVERKEQIAQVIPVLSGKLSLLLGPGVFLDVIPYAHADMPPGARVEACCILRSPRIATPKPWWKFWE